jgi:hypothetical protein
MHRTHILVFGIVAVLLAGGVAAVPVAAQQTTAQTNTTNTTNTTTTTAEPNAGAAGGGTNGGGGGGGGGGVFGGFDLTVYEPKSPVCEGLDPATAYACDGVMSTLMSFGEAAVDLYREVMAGLITFIVNRPRAMQNGEMALFGTPTNEPMGTVYDYWQDTALPAAFGLWVLFMLLNQFRDVFPMGANSEYARKQFSIKGWLVLGFMIGSWGFGQAVLHTSHLLATTLAPGAEQLAPDLQTIQADSAAAVLAALAIYFGAGFVAILAALQFVVVYIAVYFLLPALPLALALSLPDFWLFDKLQPVGAKVVGWFPACALYTVPTALVLGVGYPISGALAEATPDMLAFIPGISTASGVLLGILQLGVWFMALIAPLVVFALGSPTRAAGAAAGAIGGFTLGAASGSAAGTASGASASAGTAAASSLPAGAASSAAGAAKSVGTNPISGSSLAGTAGTSSSGGLTSATTSAASTTGSAASATQSAASRTGETALASSTHTTGTSGSTGASTSATSAHTTTDAPDITTVHDRATFDGSRKYEVGVMSGDEFSRFAPNSMRGEAIVDRGRGIQLQEARHGGDSDLVIRDEESGELFDVSNIAEKDRDLASQQTPIQQNEHSRNTVFDTRDAHQ